jgi:UDP-2-acetamido-3-amino-2,3-dideoxy-glucuronate N-acetyltransferase
MGVFDDTLEWNKKLITLKYKIDLGNFDISKDEIKYIKVHESEPLREECSSFCDVVDGKSKPLTNGLEGYKVLSILQAAEKAKSGKRITI